MKIFKTIILAIISLTLFVLLLYKLPDFHPAEIDLSHKQDYFGVTFSKKFTEELGLDWKKAYIDILDELQVKHIRLPIYWDELENIEGEFNFEDYDYMFDEGKKRNVQFIATIGWRVPRWPECHTPEWLKDAEVSVIKEKTLVMLEKVVNHYKDKTEIIYWQVENEPLLNIFGECPKGDREFLEKEIELVRSIDDRKIIISASGELSTWSQEAQLGDIFATTLYRYIWVPYLEYVKYPIAPWFYNVKAQINKINPEESIIIELQLEPWSPEGSIIELEPEEYNKSLRFEQFQSNIKYAIDMDWHQAYAWGVEWWYYQGIYGDKRFWDTAKEMFN